jgi:hypothetical protein
VLLETASSGRVSNTTINSGGTLAVLSGGLPEHTTILKGGVEIAGSGGTEAR